MWSQKIHYTYHIWLSQYWLSTKTSIGVNHSNVSRLQKQILLTLWLKLIKNTNIHFERTYLTDTPTVFFQSHLHASYLHLINIIYILVCYRCQKFNTSINYIHSILKTSKTQENILAQDEENSESPRPITLLENV